MKQHFAVLLVAVLSLPPSLIYAGGNGVSNGGGFAQCEDHQFYAYDYLLMRNSRLFDQDVLVENVKSSLQRIKSDLNRLQDPMAEQLEIFISFLFTQTPKAPFQWFQRQNLRLVFEPGLEDSLPKSCPIRKQAIYFTAAFMGVPYSSYVYDPILIQQVLGQQNGSLQVSYLLIHEWLWNYFDHIDFMKLALFNQLLHSKNLSHMSLEEFSKWKLHILSESSP